jgi:restriction system protein
MAMWCSGGELFGILGEFAGHKAGLALSRAEIQAHVPKHAHLLPPNDDCSVRIHAEELDGLARELLHQIGALSITCGEEPSMALYARYYHCPEKLEIVRALMDEVSRSVMQQVLRNGPGHPIDQRLALAVIRERHGTDGAKIVQEYEEMLQLYLHGSIISSFRRIQWTNVEELRLLFADENESPAHGTYLDQRFVDYLEKQADGLESMHWRNFERLTAEFFHREGYKVELGKGVDDDGVDVRVWRDETSEAPMVLVQCKRQKQKVGKIIVKALWADVLAENAEYGLVVTTSALQPGAAKTCIARGYRIEQANRAAIKTWLEKLRSPGTGAFLAG